MIDASIVFKNGDKARVISPEFTYDPSGFCLTWFYHMYGKCQGYNKLIWTRMKHFSLYLFLFSLVGSSIGRMAVFLIGEKRNGLIWSYSENIGDIWNKAQVTIDKLSPFEKFRFVFEGILRQKFRASFYYFLFFLKFSKLR
jgi:hypothetical protein